MLDEKYIEKITETDQRSKSNTKRLDEHDEQIKELQNTYTIMEKMDYRMGNVENNVSEIKEDMLKSKEQKGMKWDKLIDYLFYAILAYALFKLGLK
jgi:uncharacterized Ntn-hydrolase superfamily protein